MQPKALLAKQRKHGVKLRVFAFYVVLDVRFLCHLVQSGFFFSFPRTFICLDFDFIFIEDRSRSFEPENPVSYLREMLLL